MKIKFGILLLCFSVLSINSLFAQEIIAHFIGTNVACNHSKLGKIIIAVTEPTNHPPYTYTYSNGVVHVGGTIDSVLDVDVGTYSVTITDSQDSEIGSTSGEIKEEECEVIPSVIFTPNDDQFADTWEIGNSQFFPEMQVLVYTRLGQLVFEHKGLYEQWDGRDKHGAKCPDAGYYYLITQDPSEKKHVIKGCVNIIR